MITLVSRSLRWVILGGVLIAFISFFVHTFSTQYQQFSDQSQSFLHGRLDIPPQDHDTAIINGKQYWTEGPFPSVLLMPFQAIFSSQFRQGEMQTLLIIVTAFLAYKLARSKGFRPESAFFLTAALLFASTAVDVLIEPKGWYFSQAVTLPLLLGILLELETSQRWWLMGLLAAGLLATRPPSSFIVFFILYLMWRKRVKSLSWVAFLAPLVVTAGLLLEYNYVRFGNMFNNGYFINDIGPTMEPLRQLGLFSLQHIPMNLYWYFLASYTTVTDGTAHLVYPFISYTPWGLSFFLVAPFFLYALTSWRKADSSIKGLWLVIALTLFVNLTFSNTGWYQFGPRYTIDFLPILYLLLLKGLKSDTLTPGQEWLIVLSAALNLFLITTSNIT